MLALLAFLLVGCLPDPARGQASRLLDELGRAHGALVQAWSGGSSVAPICDEIGGVDTRLTGEPSLVDLRPTWPALRAATDDLLAVCGQVRLLQTPARDSAAVRQARREWQQGAERQLALACGHLREAAASLGRPGPECNLATPAVVQNTNQP